MSRLFDRDEVTGIEEWFDYDPINDQMCIQMRQDVTPLIDAMNEKRKQERWKGEIKADWVHFAKIPAVVEVELRKKGLILGNQEHTKAIMREIQSNYPYLLAHDGKRFA